MPDPATMPREDLTEGQKELIERLNVLSEPPDLSEVLPSTEDAE